MLEFLRRVLFAMPLRWLRLSLRRDKKEAEQKGQVRLQYICGDTTHLCGIHATMRSRWPRRSSASISIFVARASLVLVVARLPKYLH
jgi:hypothetical protein